MIDFDDLRILREYLEMTQEEMASALGISVRYYRMMESGEREMSSKIAHSLNAYLHDHHLMLVYVSQIIDSLIRVE